MSEKFSVLSVQKGPLESGGEYRSAWVMPYTYEDRGAPHLTRGPVPMKIDCSEEVINEVLSSGLSLPSDFDLDMRIAIASGNKSKAVITKATVSKSTFKSLDSKVAQ